MMKFVTSGPEPEYIVGFSPKDKSLLETQVLRSLLDVSCTVEVVNDDFLASRIGYSAAQAHRLCLELLGETAHSFVTRLRLECAAVRLAQERLAVNDVFADAGFVARESFTRMFAEHFSCSPSEFRKRNEGNPLPFPGYVVSQGEYPSQQLSVRVFGKDGDPITFMFDGPVLLGRVLPDRSIDWRSNYHGKPLCI